MSSNAILSCSKKREARSFSVEMLSFRKSAMMHLAHGVGHLRQCRAWAGDPRSLVDVTLEIPRRCGRRSVWQIDRANLLPISISAVVATAVLVLGTVAVTVSITGTNRIDLDEVSVVVDMDMIANAAFAGVEAVGQVRPLDADIAVAMFVQGLDGLRHRVCASASGTEDQKRQGAAKSAKLGSPQHVLSPHTTPLTRSATAP